MRESYQKLLNVADDLVIYLGGTSFEVHPIEVSTYIDIKTQSCIDPGRLKEMACGLRMEIYPAGEYILVRIYEV